MIHPLQPAPGPGLEDEAILARYAFPPRWGADGAFVSMNFVSSLDGAVTLDGSAGGLGGDADHHVFPLLRRRADVILVGAGTVRNEGYGGMALPEEAVAWRQRQGLAPQPVLAIVTRSLDLDPGSAVFTKTPVRPLILTVARAPQERRRALAEVADVLEVGERDVEPRQARAALAARGLGRIHAEGGPEVLGSFLEADAVDELCLTLAPLLVAGGAGRIARSVTEVTVRMQLDSVLRGGDELLLRYLRSPGA